MDPEIKTPEQQQQEDVASDAAFAAGHAIARGEAPTTTTPAPGTSDKAAEAPKTGDEKKVVPEPKVPPVEDEWKDVHPKVKAEFDAMKTRLTAIDQIPEQLRKLQGQVGGIASHTKELKVALEAAKQTTTAKGAEAPTQQQVESATQDAARWKQLKEDFPDWAEAVDARLARMESERPAAPAVDTAAIEARVVAETDKRIAEATAKAREEARLLAPIDRAHENWEETIASEPFKAWELKQSADVKALSGSPNPKDAIRMLDLYAAFVKKEAEKVEEKKRLDAAITPKGVVVTPSTTSDDDAFEQGFRETRPG